MLQWHPVIILLAICLLADQSERLSFGRLALVLGLAGWLALNCFSFYNYRFNPEYGKDEYRRVAGILGSRPHNRTLLLWGVPELFKFYGAPALIDARQIRPERLSRFISEKVEVTDSITLVVNRPFYWFGGANPALAISDRYSCSAAYLINFALFQCTGR